MRARSVRWLLVLIGLFAALVLLLHGFVGSIYRVESASMEPALHGGEHLLVRYGTSRELRRFDLIVVRAPDGEPAVKRVVGLPRESVQVRSGDLVVDGKRLPLGEDCPRIVLFDAREQALDSFFVFDGGEGRPWRQAADGWLLDARSVPSRSDGGLMCTRERLSADYVDRTGAVRKSKRTVNDCILACEVRTLAAGGRLRFKLVEHWDTYHLEIEPASEPVSEQGEGIAQVRLTATLQREGAQTLEETTVPWQAETWRSLVFANVDNRVSLSIDGRTILSLESEGSGNPDGVGPLVSPGAHACLGGNDILAEFRAITVERDLFFTRRGTYGITASIDLGPDEIFLLGDNSEESYDSREWGPVRTGDILGRPLAVVWPPSARRLLGRRE
jgi:signal peptidase I